MKIESARRYHFRAVHSLPGFPEPWCHKHPHAYTVELVGTFNHEQADEAWADVAPYYAEADLDDLVGSSTTVEELAEFFFTPFRDVPGITQITVWEDDDRWGRATR